MASVPNTGNADNNIQKCMRWFVSVYKLNPHYDYMSYYYIFKQLNRTNFTNEGDINVFLVQTFVFHASPIYGIHERKKIKLKMLQMLVEMNY